MALRAMPVKPPPRRRRVNRLALRMMRDTIILLFNHAVMRHMQRSMKHPLLLIAPLSMLALAACNKSETPAADEAKTAEAAPAANVELPPAITSEGTYRCADSTVLYVDFLGKNEAADIRVGSDTGTPIRVTATKTETPAAAAPDAAAPAGPMKSADGQTSLSGSGKQINVKLADKGAQTCKS